MGGARELLASVLEQSSRRKHIVEANLLKSDLLRALNTLDIILFGVGHIVGSGVWVYCGIIIKDQAGPSTGLAFVLAGLIATMAALCYAEFASLLPRAGSSYSYTYVALGEFWAFTVVWAVFLEQILAVALISVGWSLTVDSFTNYTIGNSMRDFTRNWWPQDVPAIQDHPNFVSVAVVFLVTALCCMKVNAGVRLTNFVSAFNVVALLLTGVLAFTHADLENWSEPDGFFPFGAGGFVRGTAFAFLAMSGIDGIGAAAEESKNPGKTLPRGALGAMAITTLLFSFVISALTLMVPYTEIVIGNPFPMAFERTGPQWAANFTGIAALAGMTPAMFAYTFCSIRLIYAAAQDGLIFNALSHVNTVTQVPVRAAILSGSISAFFAFFTDMTTLVAFTSVGTLTSYSFVAIDLIVLKYRKMADIPFHLAEVTENGEYPSHLLKRYNQIGRPRDRFQHLSIFRILDPLHFVYLAIIGFIVFLGGAMCTIWSFGFCNAFSTIVIIVLFALSAMSGASLTMIHSNTYFESYQVPFFPLPQLACIAGNTVLMTQFPGITWIRLVVGYAIGYTIYFTYGMRNSAEGKRRLTERLSNDLPKSKSYGSTGSQELTKPPSGTITNSDKEPILSDQEARTY